MIEKTVFDRLMKIISIKNIDFLVDLQSKYSQEVSDNSIESCLLKLERSITTLALKVSKERINIGLSELMKLNTDLDGKLLPPSIDIDNKVLPIFYDATRDLPNTQRSISVSRPTGEPDRISLNIVQRFYDNDLRLKIKFKLGVFFDRKKRLLWEPGIAYTPKDLEKVNKDLARLTIDTPFNAEMWKMGMDAVFELLQENEGIAGIDLTPAYYHIVRVSLLAGGIFESHKQYKEFEEYLLGAIPYSLDKENPKIRSIHPELFDLARHQYLSEVVRSFVVSLLLRNKMLIHPSNDLPIVWKPPRIVRL